MKAHAYRKVTKAERNHAASVIQEAFPQYDVVFGAHSDYGGHRAPRDHTISFRLRDKRGKYHSNVIWLHPDGLGTLTVDQAKALVKQANG